MRCALRMSTARLASLAGLAERTVVKFEGHEVCARPGTIIALRKALLTAACANSAAA